MTTRLMPPRIGAPPGHESQVIIRCLHGPRPEHRARRLVTDALAEAGIPNELPDVEVAVNELVSNARLHAPGPYELRVTLDRSSVKVAVLDSGADHLQLKRKLLQAAAGELADGESGRGLQIVTGLFPGAWGTEPSSTCTGRTPAKQVWITIALPERRELASPAATALGAPPASAALTQFPGREDGCSW
jgi:hypothetical protein